MEQYIKKHKRTEVKNTIYKTIQKTPNKQLNYLHHGKLLDFSCTYNKMHFFQLHFLFLFHF